MVVGPFRPDADPSGLWFCQNVKKVWLVDSQDRTVVPQTQKLQRGPSWGFGDVSGYRRHVRRLALAQSNFVVPSTIVCDALNLSANSIGEKVDGLFDAGSADAVVKSHVNYDKLGSKEARIQAQLVLRRLFSQYRSVSRKTILLLKGSNSCPEVFLRRILRQYGAKVRTHHISPEYVVELTPGTKTRLSHFYDYSKALVIDWAK